MIVATIEPPNATHNVYSQRGEDVTIAQVFSGARAGRFLDIGAWHPFQLSNSRMLYERGWSGILVEPSPEPFLALLKEYGYDERIILIQAAVATERGLTPFHASADAVSTSESSNYERWKDHAAFQGRFYVPSITLGDIFNQFCGESFDFVNIDTEGTSVNLLHTLLKTEMFPRCVCVEHDSRIEEIVSVGASKGYRAVLTTVENVVLAR
jgi:FkbM family methyltransferase